MNYLQPERLEALARAHVHGALSSRAARRFARVVESSADAAGAVARWRALSSSLEQDFGLSAMPRPHLFAALQYRLFNKKIPERP